MSLRWWALTAVVLGAMSLVAGNAYAALTYQGPLPQRSVGTYRPVPVPTRTGTAEAPALTAAGVLIVDAATMTPLYRKQADEERPIASITKLVTALTILDHRRPNEVVTIPKLPPYDPAAERLGLVPGQKFTVEELIQASLIPSANDAADALAIIDAGSVPAFTQKMNAKARKWGIEGARFSTPSGLVEAGNSASPQALAKFAKLALVNPTIRDTINIQTSRIDDEAGRIYPLQTTNVLLSDPRFRGIKTGYTPLAGQCFVGLAEVDGRQVITVVLGSADRFGETRALVDWVDQNYTWM